jgi:iron(III) transport system permease protein
MLALVLSFSALIGLIVLGLTWLSFREGLPGEIGGRYSLKNYIAVWADPRLVPTIVNTFEFAFTSLALALGIGVPMAWLAERTNLKGKNALFTLMTLGVLMPGFAAAMGWLFLLHPRIGLANAWLRLWLGNDMTPIDITTIWGMGWVSGLSLAPVAFIMTAAVFRAMDPALEDAAQMSGANFRQTLFRITVRVAFPGILAAAILPLSTCR